RPHTISKRDWSSDVCSSDLQWSRTVTPDPVLLFRYSALTFNSHRIHYDAPYTQEVEGYPGLVVHGPLVATLLLDLLHEHMPAAKIGRASRRGRVQAALDDVI